MQIGPFTIARTKAANLAPVDSRGGWYPLIRESFLGAWQSNIEITLANVLTHPIMFACVSLIASDIGKCRVRLVEENADGIWTETERPSHTPFLRTPNRYQNRIQFYEQWVISKLVRGNTYVLKQRDERQVVVAGYVLDPERVTPLVAPDGAVYYDLRRDDLSSQTADQLIVPAREIIHDRMNAFYHPLVGLSPLHASGLSAVMGLKMLTNSANLFANGSNPGGVLTAPGAIAQATADRLKAYWDANYTGENVGKVAVLGDGLKFEPMRMTSVDLQQIEQMEWVSRAICSCFHVPAYMVGVGPAPTYNNIEALAQQYYQQCLQTLIESIELCLDYGLGLAPDKINGVHLGTEFDLDNLLRMDTPTKVKAAADAIGSGGMAPNEARHRWLDLGPVEGGEMPYLQEQNWPLRLLSARELPAREPTPPEPMPTDGQLASKNIVSQFRVSLQRRALAAGLCVA